MEIFCLPEIWRMGRLRVYEQLPQRMSMKKEYIFTLSSSIDVGVLISEAFLTRNGCS